MTTPTKTIIIDIETAPLTDEELAPLLPEFEAAANIKDPEKIKANIEEKRRKWKENAALSPVTGRVLAIGLLVNGEFILISPPATESTMLHECWDAIQSSGDTPAFAEPSIHRLIGFNCNAFDLPFLVKRSWKLGVAIPAALRQGRYWSSQVTDLRDVWQCGDRQAEGSLDTIAKHLGVGAKMGSGADFAALWSQDQEKAIAYLRNDLEITQLIAKKLSGGGPLSNETTEAESRRPLE